MPGRNTGVFRRHPLMRKPKAPRMLATMTVPAAPPAAGDRRRIMNTVQ